VEIHLEKEKEEKRKDGRKGKKQRLERMKEKAAHPPGVFCPLQSVGVIKSAVWISFAETLNCHAAML